MSINKSTVEFTCVTMCFKYFQRVGITLQSLHMLYARRNASGEQVMTCLVNFLNAPLCSFHYWLNLFRICMCAEICNCEK